MTPAATQARPQIAPSWGQLADAEPQLRRLERLALWMAERADPEWCANGVWYEFLKPALVPLVGWCRGHLPTCAVDGPRPMFLNLSDWTPRERVPATTAAERMLRTSAAYDVAYDHLYDLLPDCKHSEQTWCA